jgi:hypothetical protein
MPEEKKKKRQLTTEETKKRARTSDHEHLVQDFKSLVAHVHRQLDSPTALFNQDTSNSSHKTRNQPSQTPYLAFLYQVRPKNHVRPYLNDSTGTSKEDTWKL